jgi:Protein of unknown function (DUF3108)
VHRCSHALVCVWLGVGATGWVAPTAMAQTAQLPSAPAPSADNDRRLQPFVASYAAYLDGKPAGSADLHLQRVDPGLPGPPRWRIDLEIRGERGVVGLLGLNLRQTTVFEETDGLYRPLNQETVRKGLLVGSRSSGVYDWTAGRAQWRGDVKKRHRAPLPLRSGDMSGLLINLAIVRDAAPGRSLNYRLVDGGRAREHRYLVDTVPDTSTIGELSYVALRVARSNGGNDDTIVWVAEGVPTPVRILQRENGEDVYDLRLIEYKGS